MVHRCLTTDSCHSADVVPARCNNALSGVQSVQAMQEDLPTCSKVACRLRVGCAGHWTANTSAMPGAVYSHLSTRIPAASSQHHRRHLGPMVAHMTLCAVCAVGV